MTKKDFELIARSIRQTRVNQLVGAEQNLAIDLVAIDLAFALRATNPRFDTERFVSACGNDRPAL